jgi:hypothetical protein
MLNGRNAEISAGLIYTSRRAVLKYGGQSYELDPVALARKGAGVAKCEEALRRAPLSRLLEKPEIAREGEKATGDLDVAVAQRMLRVTVEGGCGEQLQSTPPVLAVAAAVKRALGADGIKSRVDLATAEDGGFRGLSTRVFLHPKRAGEDEYDGLLELTLARVGEVERIDPPPAAQPIAALTKKVGLTRAKALEAEAGGVAGITWAAVGK